VRRVGELAGAPGPGYAAPGGVVEGGVGGLPFVVEAALVHHLPLLLEQEDAAREPVDRHRLLHPQVVGDDVGRLACGHAWGEAWGAGGIAGNARVIRWRGLSEAECRGEWRKCCQEVPASAASPLRKFLGAVERRRPPPFKRKMWVGSAALRADVRFIGWA
jgi:hypothetical protein